MKPLPWFLLAAVLGFAGAGAVEITQMPSSVVATRGQPATLSVQATGAPPLSFQWHRNGLPVPGATGSSHAIPQVSDVTAGLYSVAITDGTGDLKVALARVAMPGAIMQFSGGELAQASPGTASAVPVALSDGDLTFAISSTGGLLWTDNGSWPLAILEQPPAGSQPGDLGPVVQVAAHGHRIAALEADGTVRAWTRSRSDWAPSPLGTWTHTPISLPPDAARGTFVFIAGDSVFVVRWDGTVAVVGAGTAPVATPPAGLADVASLMTTTHITGANPVTYGPGGHALALHRNGTVTAWGANENEQTNVPAGLSDVVEIAASMGWSLALRSDGSLVQWGAVPVLGGGGLPPTPPPAGVHRHIGAGGSAAYALTDGGEMVGWYPFTTTFTQLLWPALTPLPPGVGSVTDFGPVCSGALPRGHMIALCEAEAPAIEHQPEGTTAFMGETVYLSVGATGRPIPTYQWYKDNLSLGGATGAEFKITNFQASQAGSYTVKVTNLHGEVTSVAAVVSLSNGPEITLQPQNLALHPGESGALSVAATGSGALSYRWFKNGRVVPGAMSAILPVASGLPGDAGVFQAEITDANGSRRSQMVRAGEGCSPMGWKSGQTVNFTEAANWSSPGVLLGLSEGEGWLAIGVTGKLTWLTAQISSGDRSSFSPTPVSFPTPGSYSPPLTSFQVVSVAARERLALSLDRDGAVTAWESRTSEMCLQSQAIGSTASSCSPYGMHSLLPVPAIAKKSVAVSISSDGEALALRADGRVVAWTARWGLLTSVPAAATSGVVAISSGRDHHLALKDDGTVIAWGDNTQGERAVPAGLANVTAIAALEDVSFAIHPDGTVTAWGDNSLGQTVVPTGLSGVSSIRGARGTVLATKSDGSLIAWGTGAASALPSGLTSIRAAGVMPVDPPPPGVIIFGGSPPVSHGVALVPVAAPDVSLQPVVTRVFPGYSGPICHAYASSFPNGPYTGAWQRNGSPLPLPGVTNYNATLSLTNVTAADAGAYRIAYSNGWQTGHSPTVQLEVAQPRLFPDWRAANFTPEERAAGLDAPTADPGGFGIPNLLRYALGLDPRSPDAASLPQPVYLPPVPSSSGPGGLVVLGHTAGIRLDFEVPQDTADVTFFIESSADLVVWHRSGFLPSTGDLVNGRRKVSLTGYSGGLFLPIGAPPTTPQNFFRIAVEISPPVLAPTF